MSSSIQKRIESAIMQIVEEKIRECASMYNFSAEEALRRLMEGEMASKAVGKKVSRSKDIVLPFVKSNVNASGCGGLEYNHGLFTQCSNSRSDIGIYCMKCEKECGEKGSPVSGKLSDRLEKGLMEFRDPNGRKPVHYLTYLKSKNQSAEEARAKAIEKGVDIDEHLMEVNAEDSKRGRPKKEAGSSEKRGRPKKSPTKVEKDEVVDLFASSVESFLTSSDDEDVESVVSSSVSAEAAVEVVVTVQDEGKEGKKKVQEAEKEAAKEAKKKAQEAEKEAKKKAQEAAKEAKKKALEEEKEAKKKALEEEKEAAKEAKRKEKEAQEAEKEAKKKAKEEKDAAKEAKRLEKETKESNKKEKASNKKEEKAVVEEVASPVAKAVAKEPERPKVTVSEFNYEGVVYWKSTDNIMYDPQTKEVKGIWSEAEQKMMPAPEESDDELEEEEYEEEEDDE